MSNMKQLLNTIPQIGKVEKIGLRPAKRVDVEQVNLAMLSLKEGLIGDHYSGKSTKRQITLIQSEHLEVVAKILKKDSVIHNGIRRNIIVSGINLLALKNKRFRIGKEVILEMTGLCHPCSRMEENLGEGGYNAMRGHGGITAKIIKEGNIQVGDAIQFIPQTEYQNIGEKESLVAD